MRALLLGLLWLAYVVYAFGLGTYAEPLAQSICPFRFLTGFDCPFCGLTRACFHLLHGDWAAALQWNPLAPLAILSFPLYISFSSRAKRKPPRSNCSRTTDFIAFT